MENLDLLKYMCAVQAPSGDEGAMASFVLDYVERNSNSWNTKPEIYFGGEGKNALHDCIILKFGNPRTAIFAHMDSIGYTVGYGRDLIKVGGPVPLEGIELVGSDSVGEIDAQLEVVENENGHLSTSYIFGREIDRGTTLTFKQNWREDNEFVQSCYLDNRLGCWNALKVAESLENGIIVFSCYEEHGGGSVGFLARFIQDRWNVNQALISDITWVTRGVAHGDGVAISLRDSGIPRRKYLNKIVALARESNIPFQLEVESTGGSDGNALQRSPFPFDWCFIGAPEDNVHTPDEKVAKADISSMVAMYQYLMKYL